MVNGYRSESMIYVLMPFLVFSSNLSVPMRVLQSLLHSYNLFHIKSGARIISTVLLANVKQVVRHNTRIALRKCLHIAERG
jgi:hypothetical protein